MKKTIYALFVHRYHGDLFENYFDSENKQTAIARADQAHRELPKDEIYVIGYRITVPDEYSDMFTEKLVRMIFNGDIDVPEHDSQIGFVDAAQVYYYNPATGKTWDKEVTGNE